jgi:predicted SPOUT superfamily RNA methylase MTH1
LALQGVRVAVAIPNTLLEEKESLRDKTAKLGLVARACAIYGVDVIEVFEDPKGVGESQVIRRVLEYLETPQYLRRRLFPLDETLKFAGVLPPLRIPSHKPRIPLDKVEAGEVREGVVNGDGTIDVGLEAAPKLRGEAKAGARVTVRITSTRPLSAEPVARDKVKDYWGYSVEYKTLEEALSDQRFEVKLATSRLGIKLPDALPRIRSLLERAKSVKLIFGSPLRGLYDMAGRELDRRVDMVVNLFPGQQVATVRTEEALFAGLGVVSLISAGKA